MQVSMSNHKSMESTIKKLEIQVGQLAKQLAKKSTGNFVANTEKNPKEECKAVVTRSQDRDWVEKREENTEGEVKSEVEREEENKQSEKTLNKMKNVMSEEKNKKREIETNERQESEENGWGAEK